MNVIERLRGAARMALPVLALIVGTMLFVHDWKALLITVPRVLFETPFSTGISPAQLQRLGLNAVTVLVVCMVFAGVGPLGKCVLGWMRAPYSGLAGWLISVAAGLAVLSPLWLGLGVTGLAYPVFALVTVVGAVGWAVGEWRRRRPIRIRLPAGLGWLLVICALLALPGSLAPAREWDGLSYHLALPADYVQVHKVVQRTDWLYSGHWQGQEMLHLVAMLLGSETGAKLLNWVVGILAALCAVSLGRRWLSGPLCWLAGAIVFSSPQLFDMSTWAKNDALVVLLTGCVLLALVERGRGPLGPARGLGRTDASAIPRGGTALRMNTALVAGVLIGAAVAVKNTAVLGLPAVFAVVLCFPGGRWKTMALLLGGTLLPVAPWLIRNWLTLANPVFPLLAGWIPTLGWGEVNSAILADIVSLGDRVHPRTLLEFGGAVMQTLGQMNVLIAAGVILLPFAVPALRQLSLLSIFAGVFLVTWFLGMAWATRFLAPVVLPLTILGLAMWSGAVRELRWARFWLPLVGAVSVGLGLMASFGGVAWSGNPLGCALGFETRQHFSHRYHGNYWLALQQVEARVDPGARALVIGDQRGYPSGSRLRSQTVPDTSVLWKLAHTSVSEERFWIRLKQLKVTHVLYNLPQANGMTEFAGRFPWTAQAISLFQAAWDDHASLVWQSRFPMGLPGFFLLFRFHPTGKTRPFRACLPGTEGLYARLNRLVARSIDSRDIDEELGRLAGLRGDRAEYLARRGWIRGMRGRLDLASLDFIGASRAAPEAAALWAAWGAQRIRFRAGEGFERPAQIIYDIMLGHRENAEMMYQLGIPGIYLDLRSSPP